MGGRDTHPCARRGAPGRHAHGRRADADPEIRWRLALKGDAGLRLVDLRFPVLRLPLGLGGPTAAARRSDAIVIPAGTGRLIAAPRATDLEPDDPFALQLRPENIDALHYPGFTFAQFLAYLDRTSGLLLRCADPDGRPRCSSRWRTAATGCGWPSRTWSAGPRSGGQHVPYDVVARSIAGTWQDAAEAYLTWSLAQPWAVRPLRDRDLPSAITDAPVPVMIRVRGIQRSG